MPLRYNYVSTKTRRIINDCIQLYMAALELNQMFIIYDVTCQSIVMQHLLLVSYLTLSTAAAIFSAASLKRRHPKPLHSPSVKRTNQAFCDIICSRMNVGGGEKNGVRQTGSGHEANLLWQLMGYLCFLYLLHCITYIIMHARPTYKLAE